MYWLWSGEEEAGRATACGTSHGPCQPHSAGEEGLRETGMIKHNMLPSPTYQRVGFC